MTMIARTPTSSTVSMIAVISLMLKADTRTRTIYRDMMAMNMLIADVPFIHLKATYMIMASRSMSSMSVKDSCRKPKMSSNISVLYITQIYAFLVCTVVGIAYFCRKYT